MKCRKCGAQFDGNFCSECGEKIEVELEVLKQPEEKTKKKKKPFFLRWWFILLTIIAIFIGITSYKSGGEKIVWDDLILGKQIPKPSSTRGKVHSNSTEELWLDINKVADKEYAEYIEVCKSNGYIVDEETTSTSYNAYNKVGYKLSINHYASNGTMQIQLAPPLKFSNINWPTSEIGKQVPKPESNLGLFSYEHEDSFHVYIGNTTKEDFAKYMKVCSNKGFKVDFSKGEDYYYADNAEGWHIDLRYEGNNTISITARKSDEEDSANKTKSEKQNEDTATEDLNSDFKEAMDSYESFMDDYVDFMKKYKENPTDIDLIADYTNYMNNYVDFVEDFENWENEDLTKDELAYYAQVQSRVSKKLLEVAN